MADFAARLRSLRESKNKTQAEFAEEIGLGRATINYYEAGKTIPDLAVAIKIANYFNVTMDYLCGLEEYRNFDTYKSTIELTNEFVEDIANTSELEAKTLIIELKYILMLLRDDNITSEILGEINGILDAIKNVIIAYRKAKKHVDQFEPNEHMQQIPYYENLFSIRECEAVAVQNSLAKTEISKILDETYTKLRVKLTGMK